MTFILGLLMIYIVTASMHQKVIIKEEHLARLLHKFVNQFGLRCSFVKSLHRRFIFLRKTRYLLETLRTPFHISLVTPNTRVSDFLPVSRTSPNTSPFAFCSQGCPMCAPRPQKMLMRRIATRDIELGGKLIKKGDKVVIDSSNTCSEG